MSRTSATVLAALALWGGILALPASASSKKRPSASSSDGSDQDELQAKPGVDKKRFESRLRERYKKIKEAHQTRMNFFDKESRDWKAFWEKIRDDRQAFELRITRQTLDLFESLSSLPGKDHAGAVSDFETLQARITKSFELQQKQKMSDFFAEREARWKVFSADQERERAEFMADATSRWQEDKETIRGEGPTAPLKKPVAQKAPEPAPEEKSPPPPKPPQGAKPKPRMNVEDKWH